MGTLELADDETWQEMASRQNTQANAALKVNLKLRARWGGQLRVARALKNAIDQHWMKASQEKRWFTGEAGQPQATNMSDELLYALLDKDLANLYASVDEVLETSAVTSVNNDLSSKIRVQQNADSVSFRHHEVRLLPFTISNVACALHNLLSHGDAGRPMARCRKLWKSDNHVRATTVVKLHLPRTRQVEVTARFVHRVFPEASCTVLVWEAYVEIKGSMFIRLEEKGWVVLEPYQFKKNGCVRETPGTTLRSVVHVTPILQFSSDEEQKQHIGEMTDLVIDTYNHNFGLLYQVGENLMLDYPMNKSSEHQPGKPSLIRS